MSTLAFIQARVGSRRLPGKVLELLGGESVLVRVIERVSTSRRIDGVAVLTTEQPEDDAIEALCMASGVHCVRGDESDVLNRFVQGIRQLGPDLVVRVTADSPLIDAAVLDDLLQLFHGSADLVYATVATGGVGPWSELRRFPCGLDIEVVTAEALTIANHETSDTYDREHVTPFVWRRPDRFPAAIIECDEDHGAERWTLDDSTDLEFVRAIYDRLSASGHFGWRDVLELLDREPALRQLNSASR